jgi:hypothetical protein
MNASVCERDAPACEIIEKDEIKLTFKVKIGTATETETESGGETKTLKESPMPESSTDDDGSYFDFDIIDDFQYFDDGDHDVKDNNNDRIDVDESCQSQAIKDAEKKQSPMPESSAADDESYFDFDLDDFPDFDDENHDIKDNNDYMSCPPQALNDDDGEKKESPMPDLSLDQGVRLQVPLRRSTRIAERREHRKLQISIVSDIDMHIPSQETNNAPTISTGIHSEESSPNILGSIFINGRRRSARKLHNTVDASTYHRYR